MMLRRNADCLFYLFHLSFLFFPRRESEYYLGQVDRSKKLDAIATKQQQQHGTKRKVVDRDSKDIGEEGRQPKKQQRENIRTFHQRSLIDQKAAKTN